jgi:TRAP-type C4-dicarboxylate transport system permease small subunit
MTPGSSSGGADRAVSLPIRIAYGVVRVGGALSALLILTAFAFTILAVFWRYALSSPLLWPHDVTGWTLVALIMLGVSEAYRRGDHIAIDVVSGQLGPRARKWQVLWSHAAVLAFSIVLGASAWHTVHFAYDWRAYSSGTIEIPLWIPQAPLLVGAVLLGLTALTKIVETVIAEDAP